VHERGTVKAENVAWRDDQSVTPEILSLSYAYAYIIISLAALFTLTSWRQ